MDKTQDNGRADWTNDKPEGHPPDGDGQEYMTLADFYGLLLAQKLCERWIEGGHFGQCAEAIRKDADAAKEAQKKREAGTEGKPKGGGGRTPRGEERRADGHFAGCVTAMTRGALALANEAAQEMQSGDGGTPPACTDTKERLARGLQLLARLTEEECKANGVSMPNGLHLETIREIMLTIAGRLTAAGGVINQGGMRYPDCYTLMTSKLAKSLQKVKLNKAGTAMVINPSKKRDGVLITFCLRAAANIPQLPSGLQATQPLTRFDKMTEEAIGALVDAHVKGRQATPDVMAGMTPISADMIYKQMTGKTHTPKEEMTRLITDSVERLRVIDVRADITAQAEAMGRMDDWRGMIRKLQIGGKILTADFIDATLADGNTARVWLVKDYPRIYEYSKTIGHVKSYPRKIMAALSDAINSTPTALMMEDYILERVAQAEKQGKGDADENGAVIKYRSIYEAIGDTKALEDTDTGKRTRNRRAAQVRKILDVLKTENVITGYEEEGKAGNRGVRVIPLPPRGKTPRKSKRSAKNNPPEKGAKS